MASGIALGMLQAGANWWAQDQQHRNQQDLMNQQMRNQMGLNRQGSDLQYQQWLRTNYPKQIEMMKKAGLNPALMYKGAGPGGQTGSQTGGSASGGQAVGMNPMDVANLSLINAERKLKEAQARNLDSGTDVNTQSILESIARTSNISADEKLKVEQKLKTISETKLNDERRKLEARKNSKNLTGSALIDGFTAIGLDPIGNETDMYIARGLVGAWLGKDYVKMFMDMLPANKVGKLLKKK